MYFDTKAFGQRLQTLRNEKGFTQLDLAEELDVSLPHLKKLESGERSISIELLLEISHCFEVTTDYLLSGVVRDNVAENERMLTLLKEMTAIVQGT